MMTNPTQAVAQRLVIPFEELRMHDVERVGGRMSLDEDRANLLFGRGVLIGAFPEAGIHAERETLVLAPTVAAVELDQTSGGDEGEIEQIIAA